MKRKQYRMMLLCLFLLGGLLAVFVASSATRTKIPAEASVRIQFQDQGKTQAWSLAREEAQRLISILRDRREYRENYSCGFSADLSIVIDGVEYDIASDGCPFLLDTSTGLFFEISKEEKQILAELFAKYGGLVHW